MFQARHFTAIAQVIRTMAALCQHEHKERERLRQYIAEEFADMLEQHYAGAYSFKRARFLTACKPQLGTELKVGH